MYNIIFICYSSGKRLDILAVANAGCAWAFLLRRRRRLLWLPLPEVHLDPVASQENARVNQANQPLTLSLLVVHLLDVHSFTRCAFSSLPVVSKGSLPIFSLQASGMDTADTLAFEDGYGTPVSTTFAMPESSGHGDEGGSSDPERDALLRAKTLSLGSPWEDSDEEKSKKQVLEDEIEGGVKDNQEDKIDERNDEIAGIVEDKQDKMDDERNDEIAGIVEDKQDKIDERNDEIAGIVDDKQDKIDERDDEIAGIVEDKQDKIDERNDEIAGIVEDKQDKTEDERDDEIAGIVEDKQDKTEDKGNDKIAGLVENDMKGKMEVKEEEDDSDIVMEVEQGDTLDKDDPFPASQPRPEPVETSGSAAPATEELDDEKNKVPWVGREEQQNFKASRAAAQSKRPGRGAGRGAGRGRGGRGRGKKARVEVEEDEEEEDGSDDEGTSRRNLEKDFHDVATSEEAHHGTDDEDGKKPSAKTKRPKAKAKGKAKATPKKKAKGPRKIKTPLKILKRPASKTKAKGKDLSDDGGTGKGKCFAGRRPPATGQALVRFNVMLKVYNELIDPQVSSKKSSAQVEGLYVARVIKGA